MASSAVGEPARTGIRALALNQDNTCVALGTDTGVLIFSLQSHECICSHPIGAVRGVQMLFCTSLVAYVGAGLQPALTPRKLTLLNTATHNVIQDMVFPNVVLSVLMNKSRLVVVLEQQACVYAVHSLAHLCSIPTARNPQGVAALSTCQLPSLLALPADGGSGTTSSSSSGSGTLRVYNLLGSAEGPGDMHQPHAPSPAAAAPGAVVTPAAASAGGGGLTGAGSASVLCEAVAHNSPLAAMAWYSDTSLLATASTRGTVLRVHRMPQATCVAAFRRGTIPAAIHSMAWSPPNIQPPLLAVSSSRGSVHIFRLDDEALSAPGASHGAPAALGGRRAAGGASSVAMGLVSAVMRLAPTVSPTLAGPRPSIASFKLPAESVRAVLGVLPRPAAASIEGSAQPNALQVPSRVTIARSASGEGGASGASSTYDADSVVLVVATLGGVLYEYTVNRLHSVKRGELGPVCSLTGEWALRDSSSGGAVAHAPGDHQDQVDGTRTLLDTGNAASLPPAPAKLEDQAVSSIDDALPAGVASEGQPSTPSTGS